jgi:cyclopropane fatty-acyl-phospholipid synthase-like methyltransferase
MLDIGCSTGGMLDYARSKGVEAFGVDGDPNMKSEYVEIHDFTKGTYNPARRYDLIWSVEFVEHVEEEFMNNFLETFKLGDVLMMTHGLPTQGGKHHVNLNWSDYWIVKLQDDWILDLEATNHIRTYSKIIPYIKHTAMVWKRRKRRSNYQ